MPDGYFNIGRKTLKMFEYVKDMNFDYIFRTNSSSYVIQERLLEFLKDKPRENFYCGIINTNVPNIIYASGCGYFLSRDLVDKILENKNSWNHNEVDDVSLGLLLSKLNVPIYNGAKRFDMTSTDITNANIDNHYHFRCKMDDRKDDILIMKQIFEKLNENKKDIVQNEKK
jgi:hypothetical protein